jgi:hypothetical protein
MAAKKSDPDACAGKPKSIGQALNGKGPTISGGGKPSFVFNDLNRGSSKKSDPFGTIKINDVETEISIPSVKAMKANAAKQEQENDSMNKKRRGGY